jgi:hypothetical protein
MLHEHSENSKYEWVLALLERGKYSGARGRFGTARSLVLTYYGIGKDRLGPVGPAQPSAMENTGWVGAPGREF